MAERRQRADVIEFRGTGVKLEAIGWLVGLPVISGALVSVASIGPVWTLPLGLVLVGWLVAGLWLRWVPTIRVTRYGARTDGLLGVRLRTGGGVRLTGVLGGPCVLVIDDVEVQRFPADAWAEASNLAKRCAALMEVALHDDRTGDLPAWITGDAHRRRELELHAASIAGLRGLGITPAPPASLHGDHERLEATLGDTTVRSERRRFHVGTSAFSPPAGTQVRLVAQRTALQRWRARFGFVVGVDLQYTPWIHLDEHELPGLLWFGRHLDRTASATSDEGDVTQVPRALQDLRG